MSEREAHEYERRIRTKVYDSNILTNGEWVYLVGVFQAANEHEECSAATPSPGYAHGFEACREAAIALARHWRDDCKEFIPTDKRCQIQYNVCQNLSTAIAALPAPAGVEDWQDISTAPKNGSWVLVWEQYINDKFHPAEVARFRAGRWTNSSNRLVPNVSHWKPLGEPPAILAKPAQEGGS